MTADEIYLFSEFEDDQNGDSLAHEGRSKLDGAPVGSGRYPLGSGQNPYQRDFGFDAERNRLAKEHPEWSGTDIAKAMNMSTGEYRARVTINKEAQKLADTEKAIAMFAHGYSKTYIARELGCSEGTIRNYLKPQSNPLGKKTASSVALELKELVDSKGMLDIGAGAERELGCSTTMLDAGAMILRAQGYTLINNLQVPQATNPSKYTNLRVLGPPGTTKKYAFNNMEDIQSVADYDNFKQEAQEKHPGFERTKYGMYYPQSIDSSRVAIRYGDQGGEDEDGVMYLRRGMEDISLGRSNYAQVRIGVDDKMYLKGIAMYSDGIPDGKDILFNTNKPSGTPMEKVLKPFKTTENDKGETVVDRDNVFGAAIKPEEKGGQRFYIGDDGKEHLSAINIVNSEGDWMNWKKRLSSQFLSKQNVPLISQQLDITYQNKLNEFNDIMAIENPTVRAKYLKSFADDCDASAVHLKAAALPGQTSRLLLPVPELPEGECYCPGYKTGDTVVLIRHPHAGTFEIPVLKVNNENAAAKAKLGDAPDAIGINHAAAEQLSGADFDGDTALVIPISKGGVGTKIKYASKDDPIITDLKNWSPKVYEITDEKSPLYQVDSAHGFRKQDQMGKISNLITDMTIMGAPSKEIVRAVKYSMVVIDAEKHHYDWRQCFKDNNITELYKHYQGKASGGASTLISKAKSPMNILKRKPDYIGSDPENADRKVKNGIDLETGEKVFKNSGESYHKPIYLYERDENGVVKKDKNGRKIKATYTAKDEKTGQDIQKPVIIGYEEKETPRKTSTTKMANALETTGDARNLVSNFDTNKEYLYANYANQIYALANRARKELATTKPIEYDREAAKKYAAEVESLDYKLDLALKNSPRERQAQIAAAYVFKCKKQENPNMSAEDEKKIKSQALAEARVRYGAKKDRIEITDKEWEAIQAGAISSTKLEAIMNNTDTDTLRDKAMPKNYKNTISPAKERLIRLRQKNGYSPETIADTLGLSSGAVRKFIVEYRGKLTPSEQNYVKSLRNSGKTLEEIANEIGVSTSTIESFLNGGSGS